VNLPDNGKFDVPLQPGTAHADFTADMSATMALKATINHTNKH